MEWDEENPQQTQKNTVLSIINTCTYPSLAISLYIHVYQQHVFVDFTCPSMPYKVRSSGSSNHFWDKKNEAFFTFQEIL